jgi:hypothetical protein
MPCSGRRLEDNTVFVTWFFRILLDYFPSTIMRSRSRTTYHAVSGEAELDATLALRESAG